MVFDDFLKLLHFDVLISTDNYVDDFPFSLLFIDPNLGGLFKGLFWGGFKITPHPWIELVRIILEAWKLVLKFTH